MTGHCPRIGVTGQIEHTEPYATSRSVKTTSLSLQHAWSDLKDYLVSVKTGVELELVVRSFVRLFIGGIIIAIVCCVSARNPLIRYSSAHRRLWLYGEEIALDN
jgi:hypothetical protein